MPLWPPAVRYCLVSDDDGHWFIAPAARRAEADAYFAATNAYWKEGPAAVPLDFDPPPLPDWLVRLGGGPTNLTFTDWEVP